jgi:hypothetical protein
MNTTTTTTTTEYYSNQNPMNQQQQQQQQLDSRLTSNNYLNQQQQPSIEHTNNNFKQPTTTIEPNNPTPRLHPSSTPSSRSLSQQKRWYDRFRFSTVQYALLALLALQSIAVISILSTTVAKIEKEIQFANPQLRTISTYLVCFNLYPSLSQNIPKQHSFGSLSYRLSSSSQISSSSSWSVSQNHPKTLKKKQPQTHN